MMPKMGTMLRVLRTNMLAMVMMDQSVVAG
jgi:hypothetical protein